MASFYTIRCFLFTAFWLIIYFPTRYAQLGNTAQPEVTITQGTLRGITLRTRHGRNISAFLGIPFAQPPTGELRFANPVAADGWNGTLNATADPYKCPQMFSGVMMGDEDCLHVNVYTPQLPRNMNASLYAVMVFIHGGAFRVEYPTYSGPEYILDADVVLVVLNYRLGPLGFLSTGDEVASGNWGLKDQVMALKWVQDNVRYFGGDPERVTIFGESAGAASVHLLTLSNATNGLFHAYITQSGLALGTWAHRPRLAYSRLAFELGEYVGCSNDTSDSLISCLRSVNSSDIMGTVPQFAVWEFLPDIMWGPTDEPDIEGAILTDSPLDLYANGEIRDLPWMNGVTRDEGLFQTSELYKDEEMLQELLENFDTLLPVLLFWTYQSDGGAAWTRAVKSYYFNNDLTANTRVLLKNLTMLVSDSQFFYPASKALEQHHIMAANPQYFYNFDYVGTYSFSHSFDGTTVDRGVKHAEDLMYLFPRISGSSDSEKTMSQTDYDMVDIMVQFWTSFAVNGRPSALSSRGAIAWEPYSTENGYLRIGNESELAFEVQYSFFEERMQFWADLDAAMMMQNHSDIATLSLTDRI